MEDGPPIFKQGFSCPALLWIPLPNSTFRLQDFHPLRCAFPKHFGYALLIAYAVRTPRPKARFGLFPVRSPLLRESRLISFPAATKMFQFTACPFLRLFIHPRITEVRSVRLPHSEMYGSQAVCASPYLFAAVHVLRRLPMPRHSPFALYILFCHSHSNELVHFCPVFIAVAPLLTSIFP